ncbi:sensor domain-containing protein [Actinoplanes sp. NPDC051346]|uniref:sensor histidine kinase n=1 Tax=Actinoplanes sp. NPDC051346 TaxID=3155048 RepID=UPI00341B8A13
MAREPFRFLTSVWPWRALLYLLSGVLAGATTFAAIVAIGFLGIASLTFAVGAALLLLGLLIGLPVARLERWRLRLVDLDVTPEPHRTSGGGLWQWLRTRLSEPATWREFTFTLMAATALLWLDAGVLGLAFVLPAFCISAPFNDPVTWPWAVLGVMLIAAAPYSITAWAGARAALTRVILAPRHEEVAAQLKEVSMSRARLLDAFDAERARIERDLHDGAQQRLVSLNMSLGTILLDVPEGSSLYRQLLAAQEQLTLSLTELRNLVRGLSPRVLTDNGLAAAIEEAVSRCPLPVTVDLQTSGRLPPKVESAAYFVVTEAMANIVKHSQARTAKIISRYHADQLTLEIWDDGVGGADVGAGTGLSGLADRLAVVNGRMRLSSPVGGPTLLLVEIPCRSG